MRQEVPFVGMTREEWRKGLVFLPFYLFLLARLLGRLAALIHITSIAIVNLVYYVICAGAVVLLFPQFLKNSFFWFRRVPKRVLGQAAANLCMYYMAAAIVTTVLSALAPGFVNRNNDNLSSTFAGLPGMLFFIAVFLAPLIEECFFRGLIFGALARIDRLTAYVVTVAAFSAIHIVFYLDSLRPAEVFFSFLQYAPASLFLCRAYEKSGTVIGSMLMHSAVNLVSFVVLILM